MISSSQTKVTTMTIRNFLFPLLLIAAPAAADLRVIALGDMPYGPSAKTYALFDALIGEINDARPDLVIHVGDIRGGKTTCDDQILDQQRDYMDQIAAPVIYTPGDNEWTDCHRNSLGGFNPLERLDHIRETFFDDPGRSLGAMPVRVFHQGADGFPENTRLRMKDVLIFTLHVVGSDDGEGLEGGVGKKAHQARRRANLAWLTESFAQADDAKAVIVALHADMFDGEGFRKKKQKWKGGDPYKQIGEALAEAAAAFGKPVILIYGDGHDYTVSVPLSKTVPNLAAIEVYGADQMHAVQIRLEGTDPKMFLDKVTNPALRN